MENRHVLGFVSWGLLKYYSNAVSHRAKHLLHFPAQTSPLSGKYNIILCILQKSEHLNSEVSLYFPILF